MTEEWNDVFGSPGTPRLAGHHQATEGQERMLVRPLMGMWLHPDVEFLAFKTMR